MYNSLKRKMQEGFTLVEILIVVVIIGILAAIAVPTYFTYVERGYASDARIQIKNIYENSKLYYSENDGFPEDVPTMNEEGYAQVPQSTLDKWDFQIALSWEEGAGISGTIVGTSLEEMKGGAGKVISFDASTGKFTGYGTSEEIGGGE